MRPGFTWQVRAAPISRSGRGVFAKASASPLPVRGSRDAACRVLLCSETAGRFSAGSAKWLPSARGLKRGFRWHVGSSYPCYRPGRGAFGKRRLAWRLPASEDRCLADRSFGCRGSCFGASGGRPSGMHTFRGRFAHAVPSGHGLGQLRRTG